jgi:hypothetical protein
MTISDRGSAGEQSRPYTQEKVEEIRKEEEGGGRREKERRGRRRQNGREGEKEETLEGNRKGRQEDPGIDRKSPTSP